ncbi:hypothetical protein CR164_03950 [Prosthecochloris marina]|uniref:Uncharacterized protein n=1 Tax=Prosthecochloris marina TaxID=2017681 RepID=A0A317T982_9CHLB|nr:hypothetical protein CR164_03950 [Prosthecochloris marina]
MQLPVQDFKVVFFTVKVLKKIRFPGNGSEYLYNSLTIWVCSVGFIFYLLSQKSTEFILIIF